MSSPWFKFYPSDWRSDPALRMCPLAARGLWMEMLCLMHEADPYGHLLVNGREVSDKQLASLCGVPEREVKARLAELESAGVFSREDNGAIYSRRMVRDREKAEKDKANGKGGGNPNLKGGVNPQDNPQDKAQIPDTRDQNQKEEDIAPDGASTVAKAYAFEDGLIRLTLKDFSKWESSFPRLDLRSELLSLSNWAAGQGPNWFHAVKGALAKRNREAKAATENAARAGARPLTASGNPWPEGIV